MKSLSRVQLFATPLTEKPTMLLCPWDFPGKNTGVGCHFLLQGVFLTQGLNRSLPHCRQTLYRLSYQGSFASLQISLGSGLAEDAGFWHLVLHLACWLKRSENAWLHTPRGGKCVVKAFPENCGFSLLFHQNSASDVFLNVSCNMKLKPCQ